MEIDELLSSEAVVERMEQERDDIIERLGGGENQYGSGELTDVEIAALAERVELLTREIMEARSR